MLLEEREELRSWRGTVIAPAVEALVTKRNRHFNTIAVRGTSTPRENRPLAAPIFQSATFAAADLEEQERLRSGDTFYTRYGNPTFSSAESTLAELEGADEAVLFSSGMAATSTSLLAFVRSGEHVVAQRDLYGGTFEFLMRWLPRLDVQVSFVDPTEEGSFERALRPNTRLIFVETPTNPTLKIVDLEKIAALARRHRILSFLDNTFSTPLNQRPHELGIDVVIHSATKYLAGHADLVAGVVTGARELMTHLRAARIYFGGIMDPHAAWLLHRGVKTLGVRVERQNENALRIARFLEKHPRTVSIHYPFLESHPQYALARRQMRGGGGVLSFELDGTAELTRRFVESLSLFSLAGSLGGVESLVTIPALTTHAMLKKEEQLQIGISERLIRLAVGIEEVSDLITDLERALAELPKADRQTLVAT